MQKASNLTPGVASHNYNATMSNITAAMVLLGLFALVVAPVVGGKFSTQSAVRAQSYK